MSSWQHSTLRLPLWLTALHPPTLALVGAGHSHWADNMDTGYDYHVVGTVHNFGVFKNSGKKVILQVSITKCLHIRPTTEASFIKISFGALLINALFFNNWYFIHSMISECIVQIWWWIVLIEQHPDWHVSSLILVWQEMPRIWINKWSHKRNNHCQASRDNSIRKVMWSRF